MLRTSIAKAKCGTLTIVPMTQNNKNVGLIAVAFCFIFFGFGTAQQYLVVLFKQSGHGALALVTLLLLYSTFLLTGIMVPKMIPLLGGLKRSLIFGALTYFFFVIAVASMNVPLILFAAIAIGAGAGFLWVTSGKIIADSSSPTTIGRNLSFQQIGLYSGNIAGIWTGGHLVNVLPLAQMYLVLAVAALFGTLILSGVRPIKENAQERPFSPSYLFAPHMLMLAPLIFGAYYLQAQVFTAVNIAIVNLVGIGFIPLIISGLKISNIVGSFGSGTLSDWYNKATILSGLVGIALTGIIVFTFFSTFRTLLVGAILMGFSMAAIYPVVLAWLKEKVSGEEYLYALGTFHVYTNAGVISAIGANLLLPSSTTFLPGMIALLLSFVGIAWFNKHTRRDRAVV